MPSKKEIWIECFSAGEFTDMNGQTRNWTREDLKRIVDLYNETVKDDPSADAPVVKGHPETDAPAYGWVEKLKLTKDDIVLAKLRDLDPAFVDEVEDKKYRKVSIALSDDLLLRHIGFLGAVQPAVKNLEPVEFSVPATYDYEYELEASEEIIGSDREGKVLSLSVPNNEITRKQAFSTPVPKIKLNEKLKRDKPQLYASHTEQDFGDPVHFRFPLKTKSEVSASMAIFSRQDVQNEYSDAERSYIAGRILRAATAWQISPRPGAWSYVDLPADQLTRSQLMDRGHKLENIHNSLNTNQKEYSAMDPKLVEFIDAIVQDVAAQINEEAATQLRAICDARSAEIFGATPEGEGEQPATVAASEPSDKERELMARIAKLESDQRLAENKAYAEQLVQAGKITPAQTPHVVQLLELGFSRQAFEFAEGGKTKQVNSIGLVKAFCDSLEKRIEFSEVATPDKAATITPVQPLPIPKNAIMNEDRVELYNKVMTYIEEQAKAGRQVKFEQALTIVQNQK